MSKKNIIPFLVAFVLLIAVIVLDRFNFMKMQEYTGYVDHTRVVITSLEKLSKHIKSAEIYSPAFITPGSKNFYDLYKKDANEIPADLISLKTLVGDNADQSARIKNLMRLVNEQYPTLLTKNPAEMVHAGEEQRLDKLYTIHTLITQSVEIENNLLKNRRHTLEKYAKSTSWLTVLFSIIAIALILYTFVSNIFLTRTRIWLEGFLESILNTTRNGIVTFLAIREKGKIEDFKIEYANSAVEKLLNIKANSIIGKKVKGSGFFITDDEIFKKYEAVVNNDEPQEFETVAMIENEQRWFLVSLAKLHDGLTITFQNITEVKKYQEELKSNIKLLAESNKELEQYAYVASHDLQEPLRKIQVYGSILNSSYRVKLEDKGGEMLDKINQSAKRMSTLIKDILNISDLKRETLYESVDLNEVFKTALSDLELRVEQAEATIKKDELPVIEGIALQMHQLFYNLLSNSLKFIKADVKPVININSRKLTTREIIEYPEFNQYSVYYFIQISDNGIGFNQQYAEQIFGMFKRLNEKNFFPGSGIGLALCRKVVANHNGIMGATGTEGGGATFYIILPEKQANLN